MRDITFPKITLLVALCASTACKVRNVHGTNQSNLNASVFADTNTYGVMAVAQNEELRICLLFDLPINAETKSQNIVRPRS